MFRTLSNGSQHCCQKTAVIIGAVDGKHVAIIAPPNSGSMFYNDKASHSIIFMAVADADRRSIWCNLSANGRNDDAGVFANSSLAIVLDDTSLNMPVPQKIPNTSTDFDFPCLSRG